MAINLPVNVVETLQLLETEILTANNISAAKFQQMFKDISGSDDTIPVTLTEIKEDISDLVKEDGRLDGYIKSEVLAIINKILEITGNLLFETAPDIDLKLVSDQIIKITGELTNDVEPKNNISNMESMLTDILGVDAEGVVAINLTDINTALTNIGISLGNIDSSISGIISRLETLELEVFPPPPEP